MLEAVVNVSEGRDPDVLAALAEAAGADLLDVHVDAHHGRTVLTMVGVEGARRVARVAVERIDLRAHAGVHPRIGAVDVVPFVPLAGSTMADAVGARDAFAAWIGEELGVPALTYGPERSLPDVRRLVVAGEAGVEPHPTAGMCAVGAREALVAYNVWLAPPASVADARRVAAAVRGDCVRALGFDVGGRPQVSMNLVEPLRVGPAAAFDRVAALVGVDGAELVGLVPAAVLDAVPDERWGELDLSADRTIEARLARRAAASGG